MQHHIKKKWLFPYPPCGQYNLLQIDDESVHYITPPQTSSKIAKILSTFGDAALCTASGSLNERGAKNLSLFDATAGCGGDTIIFASTFKNVVACEINQLRCFMLINNVNVYNLHNVEIHNVDSLAYLSTRDDIDVVYIDPPWGGSGYKKIEKLKLKFNNFDLSDLIMKIFNKQQTQSNIKMIALKLPTNYDFDDLRDSLLAAKLTTQLHSIGKIILVTIVPY